MSTVESDSLETFFNGQDEDGMQRHKVELAKVQSQNEVLKCTLAAQEQIETIRREYDTLRSLVQQIQQLQPEKPATLSQSKFIYELIRQKEAVGFLATSLMPFVE